MFSIEVLKALYQINQVMKVFNEYEHYYYNYETQTFFAKDEGRFVEASSAPFNELTSDLKHHLKINGKIFFDLFKEHKKPSIDLSTLKVIGDDGKIIKESGIEALEQFRLDQYIENMSIDFQDGDEIGEFDIKTVNGVTPLDSGIIFPDLIINNLKDVREETGSTILYVQFEEKNKNILLKRSKIDIDYDELFLITFKNSFRKYKSLKKDLVDDFFCIQYEKKMHNTLRMIYGNEKYQVSITMHGLFKIALNEEN